MPGIHNHFLRLRVCTWAVRGRQENLRPDRVDTRLLVQETERDPLPAAGPIHHPTILVSAVDETPGRKANEWRGVNPTCHETREPFDRSSSMNLPQLEYLLS